MKVHLLCLHSTSIQLLASRPRMGSNGLSSFRGRWITPSRASCGSAKGMSSRSLRHEFDFMSTSLGARSWRGDGAFPWCSQHAHINSSSSVKMLQVVQVLSSNDSLKYERKYKTTTITKQSNSLFISILITFFGRNIFDIFQTKW